MRSTTLIPDDRGVSEVIGSILVFGLVVALITLMQVQAVPNANEEVEFEHSSDVSGDLSKLQASMSDAGVKGSAGSTTVKLGADYPPRLLFFNPPPVNGRLTTENNGSVTIDNVQAIEPEVDDYYTAANSNSLGYATKSIRYRANYNEYHKSPISYIESSRVYHQYENGTVVENPGDMVEGRKISLLLIDGNLTKSGVEARSIETKPLSAPANAVAVTNTGSNRVTVTVPTNLSEEKWVTEILADEIDDDGSPTVCADIDTSVNSSNDRFVHGCSYGPDSITLTFEEGVTYELRTSKVGVGQTNDTIESAYLTPTDSTSVTAISGGTVELSVEVRDRYNNPVSGEEVTFNLPSSTVTTTSNADGVATVEFSSSTTGTTSIKAEIDGGGTPPKTVEFSIQTVQSGGGTQINPASGIVLNSASQDNCSDFISETLSQLLGTTTCDVTAEFENTDSTDHELKEVRVAVYSKASGTPPDEATIISKNPDKTVTVDIGRNPKPFEVTFDGNSSTRTLAFAFDGGGDAEEGDFFVLELRFEEIGSQTYFIPIEP